MDITYRFRFLIYVAAFMLIMSLCFVYAEPLPTQNHLLFQAAPLQAEPSFDPAALRAAAPVVSPQILQQLDQKTHTHRGFFHRSRQSSPRPVPVGVQTESSIFGLTLQPSAASNAR